MNEAERRKLENPSAEDIPIPRGRYRNPGAFTAFQHHFPALYGLADEACWRRPALGARPRPCS